MQNRIKKIQDELNFKQYEMSEDFGVNNNTFSNWENDNFDIPLTRLIDLSNKYNYSIDYILCLTNNDIKYKKLNNIDINIISKNLKELRENLGVTQAVMAKVCGVHTKTYGRYERGVYLINGNKLYLLCKHFNISMDEMLGREKI